MASKNKQKRGHQESSTSYDEKTLAGYASWIPVNNWPEFLLIQPNGEKVIQGIAGEVKAVKSLPNGNILVHCTLRNLLKLNVPYGSGNQPYASSRLPTIFPSPKHVNFISVKTNLQHQQPQTLMQQQRHHTPSQVLLAR